MVCRVCVSEQRGLIDTLLARGVSVATIVARVNATFVGATGKEVTESGVFRHKRRHLGETLISELRAKSLTTVYGKEISLDELRARESENLLATLVAHRAALDLDIVTAREKGDLLAVSSLTGRRLRCIEITGRLLGELGINTQINNVSLVASPDYLRLRQAIMTALKPYPEARRAVAAAVGALGRGGAPELARDADIVDAEAKVIESGAEQDVTPTLPQGATDAEVPAAQCVPALVCSDPPVIRTESFIDSATTEREQDGNRNVVRISR